MWNKIGINQWLPTAPVASSALELKVGQKLIVAGFNLTRKVNVEDIRVL